ncbi:GIY-YIG nuclease family protein [Caulobacter sp. FWC2]|uniref:GIY-YIG nuclease family protein n=1 Tax=Caulobacter sp. FWC2 TaxID=69664 RepID=UPI000C1490FE|nr:GIY-YIG nuclease family protein [Caulobacter sp. FWC2]PIB91317.1 hypothetical protein CSW62_06830 [Caulobacter sp. FWC2]
MLHPVVSGVYCLFKDHKLVYVGKSRSVYARIDEHRTKGRVFDYATVMPCPEHDMGWVEQSLIEAMQPAQNRSGKTKAEKVIHQTIVLQPEPDLSHLIYTTTEALLVVAEYSVPSPRFWAALKDGSLPFVTRTGRRGRGAPRLIRQPDLMAWCKGAQASMLASAA